LSESNWNSPAPGELDFVRRFLNTWKIPDGTREPVDELPGLLENTDAWEERFPGWKPGSGDTEELLTALRGDLRESLGGSEGWVGRLNGWFEEYPLVARVSGEGREISVRYESPPEGGFAGRILAVVAGSAGESAWSRIKACPDCRWVFYDRSRSKTRVWCGMYAGEGGRACGTISKVRRYRQRKKAGE
jgi:hypothetical protein